MTRVVIGPTLDGIPFARLASDPDVYVSEPIPSAAVVARLLTIPEFTLVTSLSPEDAAALDRATADTRRLEAAKASQPVPEDVATLKRTIDELTQANLNMSAELATTRAERDEAQRLMSGSEVVRLQRQIEQLRMEVEQGGGASIALQAENEQLREALALRNATAQPAAEPEPVAADSMG